MQNQYDILQHSMLRKDQGQMDCSYPSERFAMTVAKLTGNFDINSHNTY